MMTNTRHGQRARLLIAALVMLPLIGCDILDVEDPDVVKPDQLSGAEAIPTVISGAVFDFAFAFNGTNNNGMIQAVGLITDEYIHSETYPDRLEIDRRAIDRADNQMTEFMFNGLHTSRASAERAAQLINEFEPTNANLSLMHTYAGFMEVFLAENFCSGVPISRLNGNQIVFGQPLTTAQMLDSAVAKFALALTANPNNNAAKVGRARALLDLGRFTQAEAAVVGVPTAFTELVRYSSTTPAQNNGLWGLATNGRLSVANREGTNGLAFRDANDPRVPWLDTGTTGFDEETPLFLELVSPEMDSPVVLASGIEARLIEAEAALQAGNRAVFFARHNAIRASIGLGPLLDTAQTTAQLVDLHFRERAFWLYSTGHRLGDLRRLVRQYGRAANTVFPTGTHHKGTPYGTDVNFPIPVQEDNNPNTAPLQLQGCLDRNA